MWRTGRWYSKALPSRSVALPDETRKVALVVNKSRRIALLVDPPGCGLMYHAAFGISVICQIFRLSE